MLHHSTISHVQELLETRTLRGLAEEFELPSSFLPTISDVANERHSKVSLIRENELRIALGLRSFPHCDRCGVLHPAPASWDGRSPVTQGAGSQGKPRKPGRPRFSIYKNDVRSAYRGINKYLDPTQREELAFMLLSAPPEE